LGGVLSIPDRYDSNKPNLFGMLGVLYPTLYVVHRLDKDTSGLICFAKSESTHRELSQLFENREVTKTYWAICEGVPSVDEWVMNGPIAHSNTEVGKMMIHPKGKESVTQAKIIEKFKSYCLLEITPFTGRTHQIRVHLATYSCPIVADPLYGSLVPFTIQSLKRHAKLNPEHEPIPLINRTALHAKKLKFTLSKVDYEFEAPLPKDMEASLKQLRKWNSRLKNMAPKF
jgi:23S rRNA pseudouridine955/2504/2580 synthase/23S rRNA pseudouridine1911/1915/1917 synthase